MYGIIFRHFMHGISCMTFHAYYFIHDIYAWHLCMHFMRDILCMSFCAWHFVHVILCMAFYAWHFMHGILCMAFYAWHFMYGILCMSFYARYYILGILYEAFYEWYYMHGPLYKAKGLLWNKCFTQKSDKHSSLLEIFICCGSKNYCKAVALNRKAWMTTVIFDFKATM